VVLLNLGGGMRGAPLGALALLCAAASWAFGSVWSRGRDMPPAAMNTAAQMLCGGMVLTLGGLGLGERIATTPPIHADLALAYLVVMGSLVAFSASLYLLNHVRPALATSYAYVNPPVAVLLGVVLAGEHVHPWDVVAMAVILGGVALIAGMRGGRSGARA
jgi:drug/metabolite transporter (DMT)-like permease